MEIDSVKILIFQVAEHHFSPSTPHQADGVWVHLCLGSVHSASCAKRAHDNFRLGETNGQAVDADHGSDGGCDLIYADLVRLIVVLDA